VNIIPPTSSGSVGFCCWIPMFWEYPRVSDENKKEINKAKLFFIFN